MRPVDFPVHSIMSVCTDEFLTRGEIQLLVLLLSYLFIFLNPLEDGWCIFTSSHGKKKRKEKKIQTFLDASSSHHLDSTLTLKWWEQLYTSAGCIQTSIGGVGGGGDQDVLSRVVYLHRPNIGKTSCMFQQTCEHFGQMSNVGFSTEACWCVNDCGSLSEGIYSLR